MKIDIKLTSNKWTKTSKSYQKRVNFGFSTKQWPPIDPLAIVLDTKPHLQALTNWKKIGTARQSFGTVLTIFTALPILDV